jgi:hypothetical protein
MDTTYSKEKMRAYNGQEHQRLFLQLLADRLGTDIEPLDVVLTTVLLTADLEKDRNGFTGQPMGSKLTTLPPLALRLMSRASIRMMGEFFPKDFADEIQCEYDAAHKP